MATRKETEADRALAYLAKALGMPVGRYGKTAGLVLDQVPMHRLYRVYWTPGGDKYGLHSAGGMEHTAYSTKELFALANTIRSVDWLREQYRAEAVA